jgi:hypothetical protein
LQLAKFRNEFGVELHHPIHVSSMVYDTYGVKYIACGKAEPWQRGRPCPAPVTTGTGISQPATTCYLSGGSRV